MEAADAAAQPFKPLLEQRAARNHCEYSTNLFLVAAHVFDVVEHKPLLQIAIQVNSRNFGGATQPKTQRQRHLVPRPNFKKDGRFGGTVELLNTTNDFDAGLEPTQRS